MKFLKGYTFQEYVVQKVFYRLFFKIQRSWRDSAPPEKILQEGQMMTSYSSDLPEVQGVSKPEPQSGSGWGQFGGILAAHISGNFPSNPETHFSVQNPIWSF